MRRNLFISLMLLCFTATAGIYKWVDEEGNIHYSDQEEAGAEQMELPKAVTYTPETTNSSISNSSQSKQKSPIYTQITIVKPKMNETIRNNNGDVEVVIDLTPRLKPGNSITLYMDGNELMKGLIQTSVTLHKIDRGSHTLRASIFDKNGATLISSSSIIFHLKIEGNESEDHTPKDNSDSYTPDFTQDKSSSSDYSKDYSKNYGNDSSHDYDSSGSYQEGAEKFNSGTPSNSSKFKAGSSTYSPNYKQK